MCGRLCSDPPLRMSPRCIRRLLSTSHSVTLVVARNYTGRSHQLDQTHVSQIYRISVCPQMSHTSDEWKTVFRTRLCHLDRSLGRQLYVFVIVFLSGIWIFTEDSCQRHVDAVEWPEPKLVGDQLTILGIENTSWNSDRLLRHLPLCCEAQKMSSWQVRHHP